MLVLLGMCGAGAVELYLFCNGKNYCMMTAASTGKYST